MKAAFRDLDFLIPANELRLNRGFETVTRANPYGQHEGGLVVVSEKSLDKNGNIFAAIIEGPHKGIFTIKRSGDFDITDGAFLPDGDLLLLERSFTVAEGVKMRLRRISGEIVAKGAVADGPIAVRGRHGLPDRQYGSDGRLAARRRRRDGVADVRRQPLDAAAQPLSGIRAARGLI